MGLLSQMTGKANGVAPAAVTAAPPAAPVVAPAAPQKSEPIQTQSAQVQPTQFVTIKAGDARPQKDYLVDGVSCRFLCLTALGSTQFASFMPTAGGPPTLKPPDYPVTPIVAVVPTQASMVPIISPPDAPKSDPALAAKPLPVITPSADAAEIVSGLKVAVGAAAPPATAAAPAEEPKKRGRKPKLSTEDVPSADAAAAAPAPTQPTMAGVELYFGCSPVGVAVSFLGPYVDALEKKMMQLGQINVADLRVASDSVFGFGKWKGFLAKMAQEEPPPAGHYLVTGADERISCVADALAQIADPGNVTIGGR